MQDLFKKNKKFIATSTCFIEKATCRTSRFFWWEQ